MNQVDTNNRSTLIKNTFGAFLILIFGSFLSAFAINIFFTPIMLTMGGISGVASIIYHLAPNNFLPLGIIILILNIPLLILGWIKVSWRFVYKSVIGSIAYSVVLAITEKPMASWFEKYFNQATINGKPDLLIFCIFGGVLFGISMGLILRSGFTTGGTDILAVVIKQRYQSLTLGKILFLIDIIIVASSFFFYSDIQEDAIVITMYSFIAMFLTARFTDITLEGLQLSKVAYIISDHQTEIANEIFTQLDRGATSLKATGMYSRQERGMIFCVLSNRQVPLLKDIVKRIDPAAFVIVTEAREVLGEGFEPNTTDFT